MEDRSSEDTHSTITVLVVRDGGRRWDWLVEALGSRANVRLLAAEGVPALAVTQAERHQPDAIIAAARHLRSGTALLDRLLRGSPRSAIVVVGDLDEVVPLRNRAAHILGMATWERMNVQSAVSVLECAATGLRVLTSDLPAMLVKPDGARLLSHLELEVLNALNRQSTEQGAMKACNLTRPTFMRAVKSLKEKLGADTLFALGAESVRRNLLDEG